MDEPSDLDWQNSATSNSARTAKTRLWSKMYVPLLAVFQIGTIYLLEIEIMVSRINWICNEETMNRFQNEISSEFPTQSGISLSKHVYIFVQTQSLEPFCQILIPLPYSSLLACFSCPISFCHDGRFAQFFMASPVTIDACVNFLVEQRHRASTH